MAELIDFLFLFWVLVTVGVYILGSIYENYLKERLKVEAKRKRRLESQSRVDDWRPNTKSYNDYSSLNATSQYNSSQQYNNQYNENNNNAASNHQQQFNTLSSSSPPYTNPYNDGASQIDRFSSSAGFSSTGLPIRQTDLGHYDATTPGARNSSYAGSFGGSDLLHSQISYDAGLRQDDSQSIPTATGFDSDCVDWVNRILYLFYSQPNKYGPIIGENIFRSLNEKLSNILSSSMDLSDYSIEFQSSINLNLSTKPELKNVRTESESDKSVSFVCKIYNQRLVCKLKVKKTRLGTPGYSSNLVALGDDNVLNYELTLENLEGKLKSVAMFSDKLIVVQFMEKPDTKILLRQLRDPNQPQARPPMNDDTLVSLILQALTQVVVDLYFGDDPEFPSFMKHHTGSGYKNRLSQLKGSANEIKRQIKHDFLGALSLSGGNDNKERKIFVKLVRAKNINYNQNVTCILELDQPPIQHAISSTKQGSNPFWDEHFLFQINEKASSSNDKLTLELWDSLDPTLTKAAKQQLQQDSNANKQKQQTTNKSSNQRMIFNKNELTSSGKFLGLVRLNIDELRRNPVQKQTLMLESKLSADQTQEANMIGGLNLSDSIGGELHLELMFLEHSQNSSSQNQDTIKKSSSANSINSLGGTGEQAGDVVSVDRKLTSSGYLITTTTIAKPAGSNKQQQQQQQQQLHQQKRSNSRDRLSPMVRNHSPVSSTTEQSQDFDGISSAQISQRSDQTSQQAVPPDGDHESRADSRMSRSRSRSRGFLRAIKRRFSFSRNRRSRSVSESASPNPYPRADSQPNLGHQRNTNMDAISIDSRSRASSEISISGRAKSMPASRDSNEVPTIVINKSRLSDASSGAFTFAQPKSQLVIECREPMMSGLDAGPSSKARDLLRHYAIPDDPASERRWRRRGVKLHLFNEHQFVACHLAGSSTCHLCGRVFSRRPGKQGYKCRNCHLLSHKQCHVKVDHNCPYATKDGLKLEYIDADPPASLVFEKTHSSLANEQQQAQKTSGPVSKLTMKSISVDVDDR